MSAVWTIACNQGEANSGTFAALGLANLRRKLISQAPDVVTFDAPGAAFDGAALFPYRSTCTISKDGVQWFVGVVNTVPRTGTPRDERITYELLGPWFWLRRVYEQPWKLYDATAAELANVNKSRVILCQDIDGNRITTGAQIQDALQFCIDLGAPFQLGTIDPAVQIPWSEEVDLSCAQVIIQMLRWSPDCVTWFDYATTPPTFHCRKQSNLTAVSAAATAAVSGDAESLRITPRYDLKVPGVLLKYERTLSVVDPLLGTQTYEKLDTDEAGDVDDIETLVSTIELAGSRTQFLAEDLTVEDMPVPIHTKAWWRARVPWLADLDDNYMTIHDGSRTLDAEDYPRILVDGTVRDWMTYEADEDTLKVKVDYTEFDSSSEGIHVVKDKEVSLRVIATDATSGRKRTLGSFESGEPVPVGLAAALYAALGTLQYDGRYALSSNDVPGTIGVGNVLNLTGGVTAWATMNALVQQVDEDIDQGITVIAFGPARHLGPDDLVSLLRSFRTRRVSAGYNLRVSGKSEDKGLVDLSGKPATKVPAAGGGETSKLTTKQTTGSYTQKIRVDPAQISKTDADVDVKAREVLVPESSGVLKTRQVLCSDSYGSDQAASLTVVTAVRYDTSTGQVQVKTSAVKLLSAATESAWTMITGGQAEYCPD